MYQNLALKFKEKQGKERQISHLNKEFEVNISSEITTNISETNRDGIGSNSKASTYSTNIDHLNQEESNSFKIDPRDKEIFSGASINISQSHQDQDIDSNKIDSIPISVKHIENIKFSSQPSDNPSKVKIDSQSKFVKPSTTIIFEALQTKFTTLAESKFISATIPYTIEESFEEEIPAIMVQKKSHKGVYSGNTLRASSSRYSRRYHTQACIVPRARLELLNKLTGAQNQVWSSFFYLFDTYLKQSIFNL